MRSVKLIVCVLGLAALFIQAEDPACPKKDWFGFSQGENSFFRPLLADVRAPTFNARLYKAYPDPYTLSNAKGKDWFADVSFGGDFPLFGKRCPGIMTTDLSGVQELKEVKELKTQPGWAVLLDASVYSLLDFNTGSTNLVNTDFRFGLTWKWRPKSHHHMSYRLSVYHESTHLGDEYVLDAEKLPGFSRYNVSHEAIEGMGSYDNLHHFKRVRLPSVIYRIYGGARIYINPESFPDYVPANPSQHGHRVDEQVGMELFWKQGRTSPEFDKPVQFIFAIDAQHRSRYTLGNPDYSWSYNVIAGAITGAYWEHGRAFKYYLSYYNGVNPHGQFRMYHTTYLGINLGLNF